MIATAPRRPRRLAHRGDARHAPENSLDALLAATRIASCDGLEFDVRVSADGVPVLSHDADLQRVHGRPEAVGDLTADQLDAIGVAALGDVLGVVPRTAYLDVELKGRHDRAVVEVLAAGRGADLNHAVVSSFDESTLERVAGLAPAWPRWLNSRDLSSATIAAAVELACQGIAADWHAIEDDSAERVRRAGLDLAAWTVRRRSTFDRLSRIGVVAVCVEAAALGPSVEERA